MVTSAEHQQFAGELSERGTVLLKNDRSGPAARRRVRSFAVIGADAQRRTDYTGGGSATVLPSATHRRRWTASRARAGSKVKVAYAKGTPAPRTARFCRDSPDARQRAPAAA